MVVQAGIEQLLGHVFDSLREDIRSCAKGDDYERARQDFVFHMTDWSDDLSALYKLFEEERPRDKQQATQIVVGFLYHAIPHLRAAGKLLLDTIPDAFSPSASPAADGKEPFDS